MSTIYLLFPLSLVLQVDYLLAETMNELGGHGYLQAPH